MSNSKIDKLQDLGISAIHSLDLDQEMLTKMLSQLDGFENAVFTL